MPHAAQLAVLGAAAFARGEHVPAAAAEPLYLRNKVALTTREREVVGLAARGLPDRAVAEHLGISLRTAQTHLARAFTKLGVHRRSELAGLLDEEA